MRFVGVASALALAIGLVGSGVARAEEMKEMSADQMNKVAAGARYYHYWAPRNSSSASASYNGGTATATATYGDKTYTATATAPRASYGYGYNGNGAYASWGGYYACWGGCR